MRFYPLVRPERDSFPDVEPGHPCEGVRNTTSSGRLPHGQWYGHLERLAMAEDFRGVQDNHVENMERMFAAVSDLYAEYWSDFFHFAIFNDASEDRDSAFERTHWSYAEALRIRSAAEVLDLACGRGGFTDFLAANTQGEVLGIDISR